MFMNYVLVMNCIHKQKNPSLFIQKLPLSEFILKVSTIGISVKQNFFFFPQTHPATYKQRSGTNTSQERACDFTGFNRKDSELPQLTAVKIKWPKKCRVRAASSASHQSELTSKAGVSQLRADTCDWQCKCQLENPSKPGWRDTLCSQRADCPAGEIKQLPFLSCSKHMRFDDHLTNKSHPWTPCGGFSWTCRVDNVKIALVKRQNKGKKIIRSAFLSLVTFLLKNKNIDFSRYSSRESQAE